MAVINMRSVGCGLWLIFMGCQSALACGPTPQKVVEQITINLPVAQVYAALATPTQRAQWATSDMQITQPAPDSRETRFDNGWWLSEQLRTVETQAETQNHSQIIEDTQMQSGNFPVSQYRGVLKLQALSVSQSLLVWSARFNNQANLLDAPAGKDNATAIAAVTAYYRHMLQAYKQGLEHPFTQSSAQAGAAKNQSVNHP